MKPFDFKGIHHTAFATADMDKTISYWRDLLGLELAITYESRDGKQYAFSLPQGMLIYFFEWQEVKPQPPKRHGMPAKGPFHFDHIALELNSLSELHRLQDQLAECNFPVTDIIDHGYIHSIYSFDPNGIPLEFNYSVMDVNFKESPVLADKNPSVLTSLGTKAKLSQWPEATPDDFERIIISGEDKDIFIS